MIPGWSKFCNCLETGGGVVSTCCVVIFLFECLAAGCVYVFNGRRGRGWIGGR